MKQWLWRLSFVIPCVFIAAAAQPLWAQATATVAGRVEDATGAVVTGATVTVKNVETGATRVVTTNEAGNFTAIFVPVGGQEVRAEKTGFKTAIRSGVNLRIGQEAVVNLRLEVGEI